MKPLRLRINKDIITEFLPPYRGNSAGAIIICDGLPSVPSKQSVLEYWSRRGFWVFHPRYRGTWESAGNFLDHDPTEDVLEVVRTLKKGILLPHGKNIEVLPTPEITQVTIFGASFGGTVALLASLSSDVDKVVAFSPVVDWRAELKNTIEPLSDLKTYLRNGFGEAYRFSDSDFDRLGNDPQFFNPIVHLNEYDPKKLFIIHAKDDMIVSLSAVEHFIGFTGCTHIMKRYGGHLSSSVSTRFFAGRSIRRFISS